MHAQTYFHEVVKVAQSIDIAAVEKLVHELAALRERGSRLFLLGVDGSAGNCSHAVNDFRKRFAVSKRMHRRITCPN